MQTYLNFFYNRTKLAFKCKALLLLPHTYHNHCYWKIWPELVITPWTRSSIAVLINCTFVYKIWVFFIRICWILRHKEQLFKVPLNFPVPLIVCDNLLLSCKTLYTVLIFCNQPQRQFVYTAEVHC